MLSAALGAERARLVSVCGAGGKTTLIFALAREFAARGERVLVTTTTKLASEEATHAWRVFRAAGVEEVLERAKRLWADAAPAERGALLAFSATTAGGRKLVGFLPEVVDRLAGSGEFDRVLVEADGAAHRPLKAPAAHEPVIASASDLVIAVAGLNALDQPLGEEQVFRSGIWARLTGARQGSPIDAGAIAAMAAHPQGFFKGCPVGARSALYLSRADTPERIAAAGQIRELVRAHGQRAPERVAFEGAGASG